MSPPEDTPAPSDPKTFEPPPNRPPLEIIKGGADWILEAYNRGRRDGETYSIHDDQMEALRAGKRRMDEYGHPCLLRWDSADSVRTLYWNPDFETLEVRYDPLTDTWVIIPEAGVVPFYTTADPEMAAHYGREVQRAYDFKHLELYTSDGDKRRTIDHRFVRHEIDSSGVRFNRERISESDPVSILEDQTDEEVATATTPASALAAAVPDLSDVEVLTTEGPLRRYRAGWTDSGEALIIALDPDLCDDRDVVDAFLDAVDHWKTISDNSHVASVYDDGIGPSPWVAYDAGEDALRAKIDEFGLRVRVDIVDNVASAYETATMYGVPRRGAHPDRVRVAATSDRWLGTLADWGVTNQVLRALGETPTDNYSAPEEVDGGRTAHTPVYRLGALAYYVITRWEPLEGASSLADAIRSGPPKKPSTVADVPKRFDAVITRAMATDPADRYLEITDFRDDLAEALAW
ncbi:MAG: hypothetical protein ACOCY1_05500 [Halovenus sp.]